MTAYDRLKEIRQIVKDIVLIDNADSWNAIYAKAAIMQDAARRIEDLVTEYEVIIGQDVFTELQSAMEAEHETI